MLEYEVTAQRIDEHGSFAFCKDASIALDTDMLDFVCADNEKDVPHLSPK